MEKSCKSAPFEGRVVTKQKRMKHFDEMGVDSCQLCGSKFGLEVHHIVPITCGGYDDKRNWLLVCKKCHAMLTPTGLFSKIGQDRATLVTKLRLAFYQKCQDTLEETNFLDSSDICDIFDEVMDDLEEFMHTKKSTER